MRGFVALTLLLAACTSDTTSYRPTDRGDGVERAGPPAAAYDVGGLANVRVWSSGGFLSNTDEPMAHVGFEIRNAGEAPIVFDGDAVQLALFDLEGAPLPAATFVVIAPLGPSQIAIAPAASAAFDVYFATPVRPRSIGRMNVHWVLRAGPVRRAEVTHFTRDDDASPRLPIVAPGS